jgi:ATP-binding cassette subfamily B protein
LVPLPFIAWLIHMVRDRLRTGFEKIDRVWGEVTSVLADTIPGIRVVKAFAQERREARRFKDANAANLAVNDKLNRTWSLFGPTVALMTEFGLLVVWATGIWLIAHGAVTVGVLTAFLAYIGRFYGRLDSMSRIVSVTQKAAAGAKRIFDILDHVSNVPDPVDPVPFRQASGALSLSGVHFRYGSRSVIKKLDLDIRPGEMVGLVGHSGSGKSTLVNLICRFYDVTEGSIKIDGVDLRRIAVADYRRHIGLVLQEPFLFFGTIAENIAYGKPGATRDEIVAAARAAHAHEFILRLPHGYDSLVGERGQGLSGGERQRISIARALLINPALLILDEATSAVDTETEKEIQKALDNLVKGRTTIAIAHRLSTLRKADRLVVMDRGEIVELGNHDELIAAQGPLLASVGGAGTTRGRAGGRRQHGRPDGRGPQPQPAPAGGAMSLNVSNSTPSATCCWTARPSPPGACAPDQRARGGGQPDGRRRPRTCVDRPPGGSSGRAAGPAARGAGGARTAARSCCVWWRSAPSARPACGRWRPTTDRCSSTSRARRTSAAWVAPARGGC